MMVTVITHECVQSLRYFLFSFFFCFFVDCVQPRYITKPRAPYVHSLSLFWGGLFVIDHGDIHFLRFLFIHESYATYLDHGDVHTSPDPVPS